MRFFTRSRLGLFLLLLLLCASGLGLYTFFRGVARAAGPGIWLSYKVGHPTAIVQVHGYSFDQAETASLDFDTTQIGTVTTDATGKFAVQMTVPKTALPGTHIVQATGQTSGLTAQVSFLVQTEWSQFRFGPYHTGHDLYENVLNSTNVSELTLDWSYQGGIFSAPTVVDGLVYAGSVADRVHAWDAATGTLRWSYNMGLGLSYYFTSSPAVVNGLLYIGTGYPNKSLIALDAMAGTFKWSFATGDAIFSSPVVVNGVVYVGSDDGNLYALDAATGTLLWSYVTGGYVVSSPAVVNGVVYVGSFDHKLYALDATTGTLKWSFLTGGYVVSSPAVANGVVYVGSDDDKFYALDASTGAFKWSYQSGAIVPSSPAIANGMVYFGSDDGNLYALDAASGQLKWNFMTGNHISRSPAVVNGMVYVGSDDGKLFAFHLPGMSS